MGGVLTVAVLGRVAIHRDGVRAELPTGRTTELLVRLALENGRPVRAERLVEDLWPDGTRLNTLQAKVSQLRRALGDPAAVPGGPAGYTLVVDTVDALEAPRLSAEGAARLADGDPAAAVTACRTGLALFDAEVLPAAGDAEWVAPHRARLAEVRLRLVEDELAAQFALGAAGELVGELESLVAEHPLREGLWALLVKALYRAGRPSDALAAHRRVTRMLADELGVDPGPALADLEHRVLVHDPTLGGPPPGNVPAPGSPIVGRGAELAAVRTRLADHRLVTVVGPAGVGLDDRFALLADPTSRRPERRRTLAAALAWSYDLLFPDDQRGLWALAQFPAGAPLAGLEHVLAALDVPRAAALDVVERLVDRSLVLVDEHPTGTRYRLLDGVRAFARERAAEAGVAEDAADALVDWVAELARAVAAGVRGPEQAVLVAVAAAERATIDAALDLARDPAVAAEIATGFGWAWVLLDDAGAPTRLRRFPDDVEALRLVSWLEAMSGDLRPARAALDAATALGGDDQDRTRWSGGFVLSQEGRYAEAAADLERCRQAFAARGEAWWEGGSLLLAAFAHLGLGDVATGSAPCVEAIGILEPLGDAWALQHAEAALGRVAQAMGRFGEAAVHHGRAAASAERLGFPGAAAMHLMHLAKAQLAADDPAARRHPRARDRGRRAGGRPAAAHADPRHAGRAAARDRSAFGRARAARRRRPLVRRSRRGRGRRPRPRGAQEPVSRSSSAAPPNPWLGSPSVLQAAAGPHRDLVGHLLSGRRES